MKDKLRMGVIGCARINRTAIFEAARAAQEVVVAAVASRDGLRARECAAAHGVARAYAGYDALLADADLDVVYNPLPNSMHASWSAAALRAGKAVLCEKPLASNRDEARALAELARAASLPLIEAFHYRHHPMAKAIAERVRGGALGRIKTCAATLKIPGELLAADDIRFQLALSGGAMMDLGSYCVNILRLILGNEVSVERASASVVAPQVDGAMEAELRWSGGAAGSVSCSLIHDCLVARLTVEGDTGALVAENPFLPQLGNSLTMTVGGVTSTETFERTPTYVFQLRSLVDVVRDGAASPTPGADGVENMTVIDAIYRAAGLRPRGERPDSSGTMRGAGVR